MQFNNYTGGLFGFELPNQWKNAEVILDFIANVDWSNNQWYDVHASVSPRVSSSKSKGFLRS